MRQVVSGLSVFILTIGGHVNLWLQSESPAAVRNLPNGINSLG